MSYGKIPGSMISAEQRRSYQGVIVYVACDLISHTITPRVGVKLSAGDVEGRPGVG